MSDSTTSILDLNANDRFKHSYSTWTYMGLTAAAVLHFTLFELFPKLNAADMSTVGDEIMAIDLPPEVTIPPPPEQIARPATPVVADVALDEDITIAPTTFEDNPVENLPPPPAGARPSDQPSYIARDVEPVLKNKREIQRLLKRLYPSMLREAGIGGNVTLYVFVDENGKAAKAQVNKGSGYAQMDHAAEQIVEKMDFKPAMNRDKPVGVWVLQLIKFSVN